MGITFANRRNPDETLYSYLERRERELLNQIAAERATTATKETELAHVQSAKRQIGNLGGDDKIRFGVPVPTPLPSDGPDVAADIQFLEEREQTSIKQLIMKAMWAAFRETGATSADLRQFILDAYGRNVHPTSMSPQISRLKSEMLLKQKENEIWRLTKLGITHCSELWGTPTAAPGPPRPPPY